MIPATFALAALILGALSLRHGAWRHAVAYLASVACIAVAIWFAFGTPRPAWLGHKSGITLLAMSYQEGSWIALWTRDASGLPVAYVLPWSELTAAQAQAALKAAQAGHTTAQWGADGHSLSGTHGAAPTQGNSGASTAGGGVRGPFNVAPHTALPPKKSG